MNLRIPQTPDVEMRQRDLAYLLPGALLTLAAFFLFHVFDLSEDVRGFFDYYPFLVLVGGVFLGWRFNRTRLVFALLVLLIADQTLRGAADDPDRMMRVAAVEIFIPLNLAMISFFVERGLLTRAGLLRFAVICAQPAVATFMHRARPEAMHNFFTQRPIPWSALEHLPLAQLPFAALLLGGGILLVRFVARPSALDGGFLWALAITVAPLAGGLSGQPLTLWFATAGLVLTVSLIESSHRMAYRDELTGLPSRRALNEDLLKVGRGYTLAMLDVDHFKKVNDTYGHDVGDQVLKMVASHVEEVKGGGRPFRFGGEEFTVLFPSRTLRESLPYLEELRAAIEAGGFVLRDPKRPPTKPETPEPTWDGGEKLRVTISIGVAERSERHQTAAEVLKAADKALYKAKEEGRNRVCRAGATR